MNRRRLDRRAAGRCHKRQWRDIDAATAAAVRSLAHPGNDVDAVAIYICQRCGWYHKSRRTTGPNIVRVLEKEL